MKQNFTVRQGGLEGVEAFLSVAQHKSFRKAAAELAVSPSAVSQAVRAFGSNRTHAPLIRAGAGASMIGSCHTVPVKLSAGVRREGTEPKRLISMAAFLLVVDRS